MVVYKYTLELKNISHEGLCVVELPEHAIVRSAHEQRRVICIWAEVDPNAKLVERTFHIVPTGYPLPDKIGRFIDTVHFDESTYVFHIYEGAG